LPTNRQRTSQEQAQIARCASGPQSRLENDVLDTGITLREQCEIGDVAIAEPALADRLGIAPAKQSLPAEHAFPVTAFKPGERLSAISQHGTHRGKPWCFGSRHDAMPDRVEAGELRKKIIDDGRGKRRDRACAAHDEYVRLPRGSVQLADIGDEVAAIGEIEIMTSRGNARLGDPVILVLERPGGVDDGIDLQCRQLFGQRGDIGIERNALLFRQTEFEGEPARLGPIAAGDEQAQPIILHEGAADDGSEIPVSPQDQNSVQAWQPLRFDCFGKSAVPWRIETAVEPDMRTRLHAQGSDTAGISHCLPAVAGRSL